MACVCQNHEHERAFDESVLRCLTDGCDCRDPAGVPAPTVETVETDEQPDADVTQEARATM